MTPTMTEKKPAAKVVSPAEWLAASKEFLAKEKEFTRLRDELEPPPAGIALRKG